MCVSPYIIKDEQGNLLPVPCGHCIECLRQWSQDWRFRLEQERKHSDTCLYLTLTFRPECIPVRFNDEVGEWQSYVSKRDVQLFLKRVRKHCPALKDNLRYFAVGEYGGDFNRAHYHLVLFIGHNIGWNYSQFHRLFSYCWNQGFIKLKVTEPRNIKYVTKYLNKLDDSPHITPPFKLFSKSLGLCYLTDKMLDYFYNSFATGVPSGEGYYQKLPRYYRKKLDELSNTCPGLKRCGMSFSDVVRCQPFTPKGLNVYFNEFCRNFDEHYRTCYRLFAKECRIHGYCADSFPKYDNPNAVFQYFITQVKPISDKINDSNRRIQDIKVKHKFTKLYPQDLAKCQFSIQSLSP